MQALLARGLASGSDDGARLFRQATNLDRDIERARIEDARLAQMPETPEIGALRADLKTRLDNLGLKQTETLAATAAYPQYRVVAPGKLVLAELPPVLHRGEATHKTTV